MKGTDTSDVAERLVGGLPGLRCLHDPTRGGLATALVEIAEASQVGIVVDEAVLPIRRPVRAACDLLGIDPLYVACEGCYIGVVSGNEAENTLSLLRSCQAATQAAIIGKVVASPASVVLRTAAAGHRPLYRLHGAQLPRIC